MYISWFRLQNYKCYYDSGPIVLEPGFNIVTGRNDAGKTSLLEALRLKLSNRPHRSLRSLPTPNPRQVSPSSADVRVVISSDELWRRLRQQPQFFVALPAPRTAIEGGMEIQSHQPHHLRPFIEWVLGQERYELQFQLENDSWHIPRVPAHRLYAAQRGPSQEYMHAICRLKGAGDDYHIEDRVAANSSPLDFSSMMIDGIVKAVHAFRAERMPIPTAPERVNEVSPDAANLFQSLHTLQGNSPRFAKFKLLVREVLPQIEDITVSLANDNKLSVLLWNSAAIRDREDLAIQLTESGTGVGQVLAVLSILVTSDSPRVIIIDEPQSFLHPGAARKLMEILQSHTDHQYIISTHSPVIVGGVRPAKLLHVQKTGAESAVTEIDTIDTDALRAYLLDLGVSLSDVFGADAVLWVEGATEELCFPLIAKHLLTGAPLGILIVGVKDTGRLHARIAEDVYDLYERLSRGTALLPPAVGYIFDREGKSDSKCEDIRRKGHGRVHFTDARMFENYLLVPSAIATVMNEIAGFRASPVSADEVATCLAEEVGTGPKQDWIADVHGAQVLDDLFTRLSEGRVTYNKTTHGLALTRAILAQSPGELRTIADLIERATQRST